MQETNPHYRNEFPFTFWSERHMDVECSMHLHPEMEIILVTQGTLHMTIQGKEYDIPMGKGVFVPPFSPHSFHSQQKNTCHVLLFSKEIVVFFAKFIATNTPQHHMFAVDPANLHLVDTILSQNHNQTDFISAEAVLAPLCHDVYRNCLFEPRKQSFDDGAVLLLEYINAHFLEEITLESVAKAVGMHPVTVCKHFSRRTGVSFTYHLQYQRCAYAAKCMLTQKKTVTEIAYEAGFGSIRSFNRAFLTIYGKTPTQYKAAHCI